MEESNLNPEVPIESTKSAVVPEPEGPSCSLVSYYKWIMGSIADRSDPSRPALI